MAAKNPAEAARAFRLRRALASGQTLKPRDAIWIGEYDREHPPPNGKPVVPSGAVPGKTKHFGASRSGRKVKFEMQEASEAVATGSSDAALMAAAAMQERAAGDRTDALLGLIIQMSKDSVAGWAKMATSCRRMLRTYQRDHLETLRTVRHYHLEATGLRAQLADALKAREQDEDPVNQLVLAGAAKLLGIELPGVDPTALEQLQAKPKQPTKS